MASSGLRKLNWALVDFHGNLGRDCEFHWPGSPLCTEWGRSSPDEWGQPISVEGILKLMTVLCSRLNPTLSSAVWTVAV